MSRVVLSNITNYLNTPQTRSRLTKCTATTLLGVATVCSAWDYYVAHRFAARVKQFDERAMQEFEHVSAKAKSSSEHYIIKREYCDDMDVYLTHDTEHDTFYLVLPNEEAYFHTFAIGREDVDFMRESLKEDNVHVLLPMRGDLVLICFGDPDLLPGVEYARGIYTPFDLGPSIQNKPHAEKRFDIVVPRVSNSQKDIEKAYHPLYERIPSYFTAAVAGILAVGPAWRQTMALHAEEMAHYINMSGSGKPMRRFVGIVSCASAMAFAAFHVGYKGYQNYKRMPRKDVDLLLHYQTQVLKAGVGYFFSWMLLSVLLIRCGAVLAFVRSSRKALQTI